MNTEADDAMIARAVDAIEFEHLVKGQPFGGCVRAFGYPRPTGGSAPCVVIGPILVIHQGEAHAQRFAILDGDADHVITAPPTVTDI